MKAAIFYKGNFYNYLTSEQITKKEIDVLARRLGLIRSEVEIREYDFNFETPHFFEDGKIVPFEVEENTEEVDDIVEIDNPNMPRGERQRVVEKTQVQIRRVKKASKIEPKKVLK